MANWIKIRIKTETKNINSVRANINSIPDQLFLKNHYHKLRGIGSRAANLMRREVLGASTPTGNKRAETGGESGRYETGKMYKAIDWHIVKHSRGNYTLQVGWLDGTPGYAIFQEQGTSNGVVAMEAVRKATEYVNSELRSLNHGGTRSSTPTSFNHGEI